MQSLAQVRHGISTDPNGQGLIKSSAQAREKKQTLPV